MSDRLALTIALELDDEQLAAIAERVAELLAPMGTNGAASPWLSMSEAADYLGVSERSLQRWLKRGRVRSTRLGRRRLLHRDDLDGLAAAGEGTAPTVPPRRRTS